MDLWKAAARPTIVEVNCSIQRTRVAAALHQILEKFYIITFQRQEIKESNEA